MFWKRKKKNLRNLNLSDQTWIKIGEIYTRILIDKEVSVTNEEIVQWSIAETHRKIVKERRLERLR